MERGRLKKKIAPCSLMCHTCSAYHEGVICEHARTLEKYLEGMGEFYQEKRADFGADYLKFEKVLKEFSEGSCHGCRSGEQNRCSIEGCHVLSCTEEHGVDVCGECIEFPCDKVETVFDSQVYEQWLQNNQRIKEVGLESFWEHNQNKPHYLPYKHNK